MITTPAVRTTTQDRLRQLGEAAAPLRRRDRARVESYLFGSLVFRLDDAQWNDALAAALADVAR
jgi:hypothetical protein